MSAMAADPLLPASTRNLKRNSDAAGLDTPGAGPSGTGASKLARLGVEGGAYGGISSSTSWDTEVSTDNDPLDLESHRKTSIYLSLLRYRNLTSQSTRDLARLSEEKEGIESQLGALEGCWKQLTASLRDALGSSAPPPAVIAEHQDPDLPPQLRQSLSNYLPEGLSLVEALTRALESKRGAATGGGEGIAEKVVGYVKEIAVLKATIATLRTSLHTVQVSLQTSQDDHSAVQKKHDRLKTAYDKLLLAGPSQARSRGPSEAPERNGSPAIKREASEDDSKMDVDGDLPNGDYANISEAVLLSNEYRRMKDQFEDRDQRMREIQKSLTEATADVDFYKDLVFHPQEDVVQGTPLYKNLKVDLEDKLRLVVQLEAEVKEVKVERDSLRDSQEAFRESQIHESETRLEQLKVQLRSRETDVGRLRAQRDAYKEDNDLRKAEQSTASHHVKELGRLAELRAERLKVMSSEVRRLRGKLASGAGEENYLAFLLHGAGEDATYARHLEEKLAEAADKESALQAQIVSYAQGSADKGAMMAAETRARQAALEAQRQLDDRIALVQSGTQAQLLQQLEEKELAKKTLELQVRDAEASLQSLYTEVDTMAKAFDAAEQKLKDKVFNLKHVEDQLKEMTSGKNKADHKYFEQCRLNQALKDKYSTIEKTLVIQRDAIAKAKEVESSLHAQLHSQEKEMTVLKTALHAHEVEVERSHTEALKLQNDLDGVSHRVKSLGESQKVYLDERDKLKFECDDLGAEIQELRKDKVEIQEKLDKANARLRENAATGLGGIPQEYLDAKETSAKLMTILRCHTCNLGFKSKIIASCLHTFCAQCIDDRVKSRNRTCPYCRAPFGASDIKDMSQN